MLGLSKALASVGLMTRKEHERKAEVLDDLLKETQAAEKLLDTRFKQAITDLAAARDELNDAKLHNDHLGITFNQRLADAVQDYEADALLWRAARDNRRDRKKGKGL